jgi:hypothetical protein
MKVQLTTLNLYANGLAQMLPILVDAYSKAKIHQLLEDELNAVQEKALLTLPDDLKSVIQIVRGQADKLLNYSTK